MQRSQAGKVIPFLASKWLHTQFLLETGEMKELLDHLGEAFIFSSMGIQPIGKNQITKEAFLKVYSDYVDLLRQKMTPNDDQFRFHFTLLLSLSEDALQAVDVGDDREMIRPVLPCMQWQLHRFDISPKDGVAKDIIIRPMVFGRNTIPFGLQASYPTLFQDPVERKTMNALDETQFQNRTLFRKFQEWIRLHTEPLELFGKRVPLRIGKNAKELFHAN